MSTFRDGQFCLHCKCSKLIWTILQGCRLILDMRKLGLSRAAHRSDEDYEIEFTSNLDLT